MAFSTEKVTGTFFSGIVPFVARPPRIDMGGVVYHVLNRANARVAIFQNDADYAAFERIMGEAKRQVPVELFSYSVMPNHWHLEVRPKNDGDLARFISWLSSTHSHRWHAVRGTTGAGHLYQGRYKSFPIEADEHFLAVCRYIEQNALRAGLVNRAEAWRWSSLWRRMHPTAGDDLLDPWPVPMPTDYLEWVNVVPSEEELEPIRGSVARGRPYGGEEWAEQTAGMLGLEMTRRPRGRPRQR